MYELYDTFNNCTLSRHRTLKAAVKADRKVQRRIKRANGRTSYLPTEIRKDGERLSDEEYEVSLALIQAY